MRRMRVWLVMTCVSVCLVGCIAPASIPPPTLDPPRSVDNLSVYGFPTARVNARIGLYASPNRSDLVGSDSIPTGTTVYLMGRNSSGSHMRVVWRTRVGWIPTSVIVYNGDRAGTDILPILAWEPPACAEPITPQLDLDDTWTSKKSNELL